MFIGIYLKPSMTLPPPQGHHLRIRCHMFDLQLYIHFHLKWDVKQLLY